MSRICLTLFGLVPFVLGRISTNLPHVIWLVADDLGHADVGFYNSSWTTPAIDALANQVYRCIRECPLPQLNIACLFCFFI